MKKTFAIDVLRVISKPLRFFKLQNIPIIIKIHQSILKRLTPDQTVVKVNGYLIEIRKDYGSVSEALLYEREYEPMTTRLFKDALNKQKNKRVIDIGANIGYYTLLASSLASTVTAVEPESKNILMLKNNIKVNNFTNVTVLASAASDAQGESNLYVSGISSGMHSLVMEQGTVRVDKVRTITLDGLDNGLEVGIVKIDTEGNDINVLKGGRNLLTKYKPTLFVEYFPSGINNNAKGMLEILRNYGYKSIQAIDETRKCLVPADENLYSYLKENNIIALNLYCEF
jgi:FkbM family methyltransferase